MSPLRAIKFETILNLDLDNKKLCLKGIFLKKLALSMMVLVSSCVINDLLVLWENVKGYLYEAN